MVDATDFPFDASKYAYRTNTEGLAVKDDAAAARFKTTAEAFEKTLKEFESQDKKARDDYNDEKEYNPDIGAFRNWVPQNFPQWNESEQDLSSKGAELTQLANLAFGAEYNEKIRDAQQAIVLAAYQGGGYTPRLY